ncbi:carboxypeptidase-like regulatory domain-containing protein [Pedobacter sp. B4-66]|uniref:carboxypeptidase-like regulatory domain-containing protein n=1 Tax=Pedobacter sp. B4-66 TaxID=2817280 RepID=UPI001BD9B99C|nr:carboxypeptidase-like regulatory domain-containing protein [Pedobacter sp. B4-66]
MKFKRTCLFFLVIPIIALFAFIPRDENPLEKIISSLSNWSKVHPVEKVYLHMDKPYYALGDTIWFKAYITVGSRHQLSAMSGALYVDLINEKDSILKTLKLPVSAGTTLGDFALQDEWHEGNYRIRAYTQWMRNAGEDYFFDHLFMVGSSTADLNITSEGNSLGDKTSKGSASTSQKNASTYDIQFFPEGGNLINGVVAKVAFKAVAPSGYGAAIKGTVVDDQNTNIIEFKSEHAGIGYFTFKPEEGRSYSAKVTTPDGNETTIPLPKAVEDGYALAVFQPEGDSVLVRINVSAKQLNLLKQNPVPVSLIVQSGGESIFTLGVNITTVRTSIWLKKSEFPMGIAQFTLFAPNGEPLNERIAFIKNKDHMQLEVASPKSTFKSKDKVELQLVARNGKGEPVPGSFSISVIDESKVPLDEAEESTIFSNILLSSDLKGYIEKPNYYFTKDSEDVNRALDGLMLTQGYRRFSWKEITGANPVLPKFKAEQLGSSISGVVKTLSNKVFAGAKVKLFSLRSGIMLDTISDAAGRFSFDNLVLTDSIKLTVQATTAKNGNKLELIIDTASKMGLSKHKFKSLDSLSFLYSMKAYVEHVKKQDALVNKMGRLSRVQRLKEVTISARKKASQQYTVQGIFQVPGGHSDQTFVLTNPEGCATLAICLQGMLHGVVFRSSASGTVRNYPFSRNTPMTVYLDGRKLDLFEISDLFDNNLIDPSDVGKIEVVRTNTALLNMFGGVPSLFIITKNGYFRKTYQPNIVNITPKGFNKVRDFYSPKYDRPSSANVIPDLRSTIYWNANVKTYSTGKATLNYFNADGPGSYKVVVEGINAEGELGRQVFRYKVEAGDQPLQTEFAKIEANAATRGLDSLNIKLPMERVYLHIDKTSYNIGDTLWFKGYVMSGSSLSATKVSGVLLVELNNDSAEVVRRISVPIKNGIAMAQIPLPSKIFREGGYTLRAYTNWMQNFGEGHFFNQRFYLGLPQGNRWLVKSSAVLDSTEKSDELKVDMSLFRLDRSPVALRDVEVYLYDMDNYLYKEKLQTGSDGRLQFSKVLSKRVNGKNIRVEVRSLHPADKSQVLQVPLTIARTQKIDLQFMPEGGKLVAGLKSVVGFKALAENGKGTSVEGSIVDREGKVVSSFSSVHNGMGSFEFMPLAGEIYTAKITKPSGSTKDYPMPKVSKEGVVMTVQNLQESDFVTLKITATPKALTADSIYYLIGTTRGKVYLSEQLSPKEQILNIPKTAFPTGVSRFTLLKGTQPINERVVFINHHQELEVSLVPAKTSYTKRAPVEIEILVKDRAGFPVKGNFSLAVTDDSQVLPDSSGNLGIAVSFLMNSGLRGNIESPAYYLGKAASVATHVDNLMLTQGWTDYDWKNVFKFPKKIPFAAEDGYRITGLVKNLTDKPVANAPVLISSQKPSFINTTTTDSTGRYVFKDLPPIDTGSFFIQARTAKGKTMRMGEITVDRFRAPKIPQGMADVVMPWYVNSDSTQIKNYSNRLQLVTGDNDFVGDGVQLAEVSINATKIIKGSENPYGEGKSDLAFDAIDIKESGTANLYQLLKQKVPGFRLIYDYENLKGDPAIRVGKYVVVVGLDINIDGRPLELSAEPSWSVEGLKDALAEYQLANIRGVEVIYSRKYTVGTVDGAVGYREYDFAKIEITTLNGKGWYRPVNNDVVYYRPLPIMRPQQFYSPKYTTPVSVKDSQSDSRSTIFWEPNVITDSEGRAKVSFYTSDVLGGYTISLEGSDMKGAFGSGRKGVIVKEE